MVLNQIPYKVLLPERLWKEANDKKHLKRLVLEYMERYPHYKVIKIQGKFAVCIRK